MKRPDLGDAMMDMDVGELRKNMPELARKLYKLRPGEPEIEFWIDDEGTMRVKPRET